MGERTGYLSGVYDALASVKLTVIILLTLAVSSVIGTLLPQGIGIEELQHRFSPGVARWIDSLGLNNLYTAGWFRLILLTLCVNLTTCTIKRLPKTIKLLRYREEQISAQKLSKFGSSLEMAAKLPLAEIETRLTKAIGEEFGPLRKLDSADSFCAVSEKGRWSRLMVYAVHVSVLIVLLGALTGSLFGFKGFMNIPEGSSSDEVVLSQGRETVALPFQIRCDDFDVSFYDTGAPKEFRSDLTILQNDREVLKQAIRVNDPLTYGGVTFYQASYGALLKEAEVEFTDKESGKVHKIVMPYRQIRDIPGTRDQAQVVEFVENLSGFGPALAVALARGGENPTGSYILADRPDFHGNRVGGYAVKIVRFSKGHYTGLQVKKDPGVWIVWFGFTLMVVGIGMTFYSSHRKIWVCAEPARSPQDTARVVVAGRTSKNSLAFDQEFNKLCERLQADLKS